MAGCNQVHVPWLNHAYRGLADLLSLLSQYFGNLGWTEQKSELRPVPLATINIEWFPLVNPRQTPGIFQALGWVQSHKVFQAYEVNRTYPLPDFVQEWGITAFDSWRYIQL